MIGTVKAEPRSDSHCPPSKNQIPGHLDSSQVGRTDNTGLLLRTKRRTHSYSRRGRTGALSRPSGVDMSLRYVHRLDRIAEKGAIFVSWYVLFLRITQRSHADGCKHMAR